MIYDLDGMLPERAFQRDARGQIKPQSGGGGSAPAQQNVTTTSIPEYARPYVEKSLGQAAALTDISQNPYQSYSGQRISAFTPLQAQAMQSVSGMQVAPQISDASNLAYAAGQGGLKAYENSIALQNASLGYGSQGADIGIQGGTKYGAQGAGYGANAASMAGMGYGAGAQYAGQATNPYAVGAYMSPYMQNVVDVQKQEANRGYDISGQQVQGQGVAARAFGGSRDALMRAENERNRNTALNQIQAQGTQSAYDKAMQSMQFGSNLGIQGLQAGTAAQQAGIQGAQTGLQGVNTALAGNAQGLQGVQGAVNAGQYGLSGLGLSNQSAGTLGQLGQTQFGQQAAITDAQMRAGATQQALEQRGLDTDYQQFQDQLNYPYKQLGFMSDIYRGLPLTQGAQSMYQNPSAISQAAGLGTAAYGLYQMGKKNGGVITEGDGLDALGLYNAMRKQG